ncbi:MULTISPECIES: metallophosphoesterase family protein [unclassified Sphingomonas]|uniref:metallophosphoesterase family protein n=1 Tax=unclassified Sphingomonas TaxID=196159 RepID=UPI00226AB8D5|nr:MULTISPECIES: metallophosphoesterase family protein [unclassified Sphingomonas]
MKIAAISDIHGNIAALDAVLADIAKDGVDLIVNLGDICSGALFPAATAARLMPLGLPTIRGNHERQLGELPPERLGLSDRHAAATLDADHRAWLASLPTSLRLDGGVLLVHGTPASDVDYFLDTVTADGARPASEAEVEARAAGADAAVILCGHTHLQRAMTLGDGRLIVNPGSVGLPVYDDDRPFLHRMESGSPHARYAVIDDRGGRWSADFRKVAYDWEQAACDADANGRADWARALRTGYC